VGRQGAFTVLTTSLATVCLLSACAEATRYRVLSFFFDGVPRPGTSGVATGAVAGQPSAQRSQAAPKPRVIYPHSPYREKRCRDCHDPDTGLLLKTVSEGLCQACHPGVPGSVTYVHGPVAVNECLTCHSPHQARHPRLLLDDVTPLCFSCHKRSYLSEGAHHEDAEDRDCSTCHDPHGGSGRFFLRRSER
jgi:predicted CXXCH cytochrome family protein